MNALARLRRSGQLGLYVVGSLVVLGFLMLIFWRAVFVVIPAGHIGVLYDLLFGGTRVWRIYGEGLRIKLPWNRMYVYDARLQSRAYSVKTLSREGMWVDVDFVALFRIDPQRAALLHKSIGPEYVERVVGPVAIGVVREYVTRHDSNELYTVDSEQLQSDIRASARALLDNHHLVVAEIIVERLTLPPAIVQAIEQKLIQEQSAASYVFRLEGEKAEAERLRIKAQGLQAYYSIVNSALSPSLLTWRGIEATVEIAQSDNTKVVIVGGGRDQMPLILGSELLRGREATPAAPGPAGAGPAAGPGAAGGPAGRAPRVFAEPPAPPGAAPAPPTPAARPGAPAPGSP
jgi:regulator of protease activity HflC (stomatin/prohibitin superfamily)